MRPRPPGSPAGLPAALLQQLTNELAICRHVAAHQGLGPSHGLLAGFEVKTLVVETQDHLGAWLQPQGLPHLDRYHQSASFSNACHVFAHVAQLTTVGTSKRGDES